MKIILALLILSSLCFAGDLKMGVIDMQAIQRSEVMQKMIAVPEDKAETKDAFLDYLKAELEKVKADKEMAEPESNKKQVELSDQIKRQEGKLEREKERIEKERQQFMANMAGMKILAAVEVVCKKRRIEQLVDKRNFIYFSGIDVTEEVIAELGK